MKEYRRLWQGVIIEALAELAGIQPSDGKQHKEYYQRHAHRWFFIDNPDFHTVCDYAEWHPEYVRSIAAKVLKKKPVFQGHHKHQRTR